MKTNKNSLMRLFKNAGACDTVNFKQNLQMATGENYNFTQQMNLKQGIEKQMFNLNSYLNEISAYAKQQNKKVTQNTYHYRFKKTVLDSEDDDDNDGDSTMIRNDKQKFLKSSYGKPKQKYNLLTTHFKFDFHHYVKEDVKSYISLKNIEDIGTDQYQQKIFQEEEYYDLIAGLKGQSQKFEIKDKELLDYLAQKVSIKFKIRDMKRGVQTSLRAQGYEIQFTRDLSPHPQIYSYDIPLVTVEKKNHVIVQGQVNKQHMLEIAARVHRVPQLYAYIKKICQQRKKMINIQIDNELEARMQQIKAKIKVYKDKRKQKKEIKTTHSQTQTQKMIFHEDIKDILQISDKLLVNKIQKLNEIKQIQIQNGKDPVVLYQQLNPIINNHLYNLLLIIASGQEFISWSDYLLSENEREVEKSVLNIIYKNLYSMDNRCCPSGTNKMQLLDFYSSQKIRLEKQGIPDQKTKTYTPIKKVRKQDISKTVKIQYTAQMFKSMKKIPISSFMSSNKNIKSYLRSTKNFNETTKQNTTNFNLTKRSINQNMQNKIDRLFKNQNQSFSAKKDSLSPITRKSVWSKIGKGSKNPFAKNTTPRK